MSGEPNVYIALEYEGGQLTVHGPLELLDRLVATLSGAGTPVEAHAGTGLGAAGAVA